MLRKQLDEEWRSLNLEGRLTRGARAGLMGVSIGTAERILHRKGNDRAVLHDVFKQVGLDWDESFCEPMPGTANPLSTAGPANKETESDRRARFRLTVPALSAGAFLGLYILFWTLQTGSTSQAVAPGDLPEVAREPLTRAWRLYHAGHYPEALRYLHVAESIASRRGEISVMAETRRLQGEVAAAEGDLLRALRLFDTALVLRKSFRFDQATASLLEVIGDAELRLGRFDDAEGHLTASYEGLVRLKDFRGAAATARTLGSLALARRNGTKAREWFSTSRSAMAGDPDPQLLLDLRAQEASILVLEGKARDAVPILEACLDEWRRRDHERWVAKTSTQLARALLATGDRARALRSVDVARKNFESVGDRLGVKECSDLAAAIRQSLSAESPASSSS